MASSSARTQAAVALGAAAVLGGAWLLFGTPLRVRWIVARGAPPAEAEDDAKAAADLRALGKEARPHLLAILVDGGARRPVKSWVGSLLLRGPWFDRAAVEAALASPEKSTARAAAYALLDGDRILAPHARSRTGPAREAPRAPLDPWDASPAVPVLVAWMTDAEALDAHFAAALLGEVPPGDRRVRDALLGVVEGTPEVLALADPIVLGRRKLVVAFALKSLVRWAGTDPEVPARVAKVVAWIEEQGKSAIGWDIQTDGLNVVEAAGGAGTDPAILRALSLSPNHIVRMKVCHALEKATGSGARELLRELLRDESYAVRRSAILALRKRKDPMLIDLAPYLVEDAEIFCRSDTLLSLAELRGTVPERLREVVPLLVACLEEPWPGEPLRIPAFEGGRAAVIEGAALSLYMITDRCPGFVLPGPSEGKPDLAITDYRRRGAIAAALAADAAKRKAVVDEWRKSVPPLPESKRVPALVQRLEDRDPAVILRACRELKRVTGESGTIPDSILVPTGDDTDARNAIRELRKKGEWTRIVEAWKARK